MFLAGLYFYVNALQKRGARKVDTMALYAIFGIFNMVGGALFAAHAYFSLLGGQAPHRPQRNRG